MKRLLYTNIFLILVLLSSAPLSRAQRQAEQLPLITVSGQAEVKVEPNEVVFTLSVVKLDKDLMAAKEQNDQSVRRIMELTRRYNIAPQDVQTDYISVEPQYREERKTVANGLVETKMIFDGYQVSKTVAILLKDISRFESFLTDILRAGIDRLGNVEFRTSDMRRHRDRARALAIAAAREKAVALTREIGQTIGTAYSIREDSFVAGSSRANTSRYSNNVSIEGLNSNVSSVEDSGSNSTDEESRTIAPGRITVTARVIVSFRLQ